MKQATFEKTLRRLNKLALEMDEWCHATHPSGWDHVNKKHLAEYKRLAKKLLPATPAAGTPGRRPSAANVQLSLFDV